MPILSRDEMICSVSRSLLPSTFILDTIGVSITLIIRVLFSTLTLNICKKVCRE